MRRFVVNTFPILLETDNIPFYGYMYRVYIDKYV